MSRFEFKLPDIGEGVSEGEIVGWLVHVGDAVSENQDMVEVMTDKATVTIGAPKSGKVVELRGGEGDTVPVGTVLVVLDVGGGDSAATNAKPAANTGERPATKKAEPAERADAKQTAKGAAPAKAKTEKDDAEDDVDESDDASDAGDTDDESEEASSGSKSVHASAVGDIREDLPGIPRSPKAPADDYRNDKPLASPATRKLARERGVDLRRVRPSGDAGRVTREDVERMAVSGAEQPAPAQKSASRAPAAGAHNGNGTSTTVAQAKPPAAVPTAQGETRVPIRGLRKRIYENMARAKHTAAHFTYVDECDVTELKRIREAAKSTAEQSGVHLTYLPLIVKAVVGALKRHPALNCLVDDAAMEMVLRTSYDIGIAVATEGGLTVPVLRNADRLTVIETAREIDRLGTEARTGKTRREDLGGSSFTITSLGKDGGLFATPIVNYPEVAILGIHQMKRKPVIRGDQIVPGEVMLLSLSFDHRIIDGHVGAAFAQEVIHFLEAPERLLLEMR
ncbi:MAG TPA: dihydrolipoamide acetyltransferase family protein [Polyangiaceae bacterium]|jgi:pyruvate dehydrogenase E2 component (dihydrolipoamide acetyltransferase)|nr:dihydrolipoamide acetyltransferase family protein [Polyangiaceae bacterium]